MVAFIFLLIIGVYTCPPVQGLQTITSPLNGKVLELSNDTAKEYSFLIAGHLYGSPGSSSVYPSASFLANIDMINQNNASFFVLLGDNYQVGQQNYVDNFKASVCSKIEIPMFNAVGNHDVMDRELYDINFGRTYFDFKVGSELFIILDSEINQGEIVGDQLSYLNNTLNRAADSSDINNVFIFVHKLIWAVNNENLDVVYQNLNSRVGYTKNNNFKSSIMPDITRLAKTKEVYIISGDIGVKWSLPLFYYEDEKYNISYVACGLGDTDKDAIVQVDILKGGEVTFKPLSLTGQELDDLSYYGTNYWTLYFNGTTNNDGVYKYIGKTDRAIRNIYFQFGFVLSLVLVSICIGGLILHNRIMKK